MSEMRYVYSAEVKWTDEKKGNLLLDEKPDLPVATPPEFGGHDGLTSPEDLYVASAVVCIMSTFLAMGAKVKAEWKDFSCRGEGVLEKVPEGGLQFTRIDLYPKVLIEDEKHAAPVNKALDLAGRYCLVTNSMKSEVVLHPEVIIA